MVKNGSALSKEGSLATFHSAYFCFVFVYFKGVLPVEKQVKIGVTYMTMNNDFYKTLNAELEKKPTSRAASFYVRDPELDEGKQSQQIDFLSGEKVDVIVINPVKAIVQASFPLFKGQESWD